MKPAIEWLNEVAETVVLDMFSPSQPPGQKVLQLIERIQNDVIGAYETAAKDRHIICLLGDMLIGTGKQCYSADAVLHAVNNLRRPPKPE